ncbi:MAG: four helix bundle protein [Desulfobacterales bacterium]|nr:four helix bundle protein [Desulfobacterales bacterium]MDD4394084.1 four helix bundle protein [Desulfobacterales bacterium]
MTNGYRGYKDLKLYQKAYEFALQIHKITKTFPKDEKYSLVDQIRRSSRSVAANLAEAWKKRRYEKAFISKLIDCAGEAGETEVWLDFSRDFGYIDEKIYRELSKGYDEVGRMLSGMIDKSGKFCNPRKNIHGEGAACNDLKM